MLYVDTVGGLWVFFVLALPGLQFFEEFFGQKTIPLVMAIFLVTLGPPPPQKKTTPWTCKESLFGHNAFVFRILRTPSTTDVCTGMTV